MIALRGVVYKDEEARWKWSGVWTFGTLPAHVGHDRESLTAKIPNVRPVEYTWEKPLDASAVKVPSLELQNLTEGVPSKDRGIDEDAARPHPVSVSNETVGIDSNTPHDLIKAQDDANAENSKEIPDPIKESINSGASSPSFNRPLLQLDSTLKTKIEPLPNDCEEAKHLEKMEKVTTFATTQPGDPTYTEASTLFDCPPDGSWSGYFENIIRGRKADNRISESLSLFWNATPSKDASSSFLEDCNDDDQPLDGKIHVRGMGINQFGVFELTGSYNTTTKVLELQRIYVSTTEQIASKPSPSAKVIPTRKTSASRAYSTRKRKLSWQRRSTLSDDEDEIVGMHRHLGPSKKKPRVASVVPVGSEKSTAQIARQTTTSVHVPLDPGIVPTKQSLPMASTTVTPGPKKRGAPHVNSTGAHTSSPTLAFHGVTLPSVGDPDEARWRAAHYLYYQRNDPTSDEGSAGTNFVVYEGEMLHGKCMRHGRGVCLYNDGTIYEGEWKHNREHGKGELITADRSRVIYKGEWERGRMHGSGIYYYFHPQEAGVYPGANPVRRSDDIPRYEGEFKENSRHGTGKYFLPDGSTYEGEWRENLMSGRGVFVWPDGSTYIGQWKDGKRHGQGLLQAADNFVYDGMWVDNSMEGRGTAQYPSGQRYEGLWSNGRRDGRGTIQFVNGAIYEGRFRDDVMEGQGTMKMTKAVKVPENEDGDLEKGWMIPISFQSDMGRIHQKAGFTLGGE